jgi:hypothetical protein
MFSPAEREYLRLVSDGPSDEASERLKAAFPNPAYRRKLMWGIRHKARRSLDDWQLYADAARDEERLLPRAAPADARNPPLYEDSIVVLLRALRQRLHGSRRRAGPGQGGRGSGRR